MLISTFTMHNPTNFLISTHYKQQATHTIMQIDEAKEKLIQSWGALGTSWGVNRTMAQVHALLLIATSPLSAEDVMEQLQISRGNANMNLRALIDWGLAKREYKVGERREFFVAEKDMWRVAMIIIRERQKRELAPILQILQEVKNIDNTEDETKKKEFVDAVENLNGIVSQANNFIEFIAKTERHWLAGNLVKLFANKLDTNK